MRRLTTLLVLLASLARAEEAADPAARVLPSLVKIVAVCGQENQGGSRVATGFVAGPGQVVTDMHVVVGCATVTMLYFVRGPNGWGQTAREATVARVLRAADLALLAVKDAPDAPPLALAEKPPSPEDWVEAWGFPLGVEAPINTRLQVTFANDLFPQLSSTLDDTARAQLTTLRFPALTSEVLHLSGPLQPGDSGAPVLDAGGALVGIGSGGLQQGAASISWAMRAHYVRQLLTSTDTPPAAGEAGTLFAMVTSGVGKSGVAPSAGTAPPAPGIDCGGTRLILRGTRPLADLTATGGPPLPEAKLASLHLEPSAAAKLAFDLWVDPVSGATVAVPAGTAPAAADGYCHAALAPGVTLVVTTRVLPTDATTPEWRLGVARARWRALERLARAAHAGVRFTTGLPGWQGEQVVNGALLRRTVMGTIGAAKGQEKSQETRLYRADLAGRGMALTVGALIEPAAMDGPGQALALATVSLATFPPLDRTQSPLPGSAPAEEPEDDAPASGEADGFASIRCGALFLLLSSVPDFGTLAAHAPDPVGLARVVQDAAGVPADRIARAQYDVWAAATPGIAVPVPRGMRPEQASPPATGCRFTGAWNDSLGAIIAGKAPKVASGPAIRAPLADTLGLALGDPAPVPGAKDAWRMTGTKDGHAWRVIAFRQQREGWAALAAVAAPDGPDPVFAAGLGAALLASTVTDSLAR